MPFELQNDFSVAILGLSKFFREDIAVTAQTMLIGNRSCRIYGEPHAEYLLLQMTGEHELQSMESEVTAIAQSAHYFLLRPSRWKAGTMHFLRGKPLLFGEKQGFGGNAMDTLRFLTELGHSHAEAAASSPGEHQNHSGRLIHWPGCLLCGHPPRLICSMVSPPHPPLCGFRVGRSSNNSTRYRHSTFI